MYFFLNIFPLIDLHINRTLRLLPVPGLPIIINGMLVITETNNENIFYFNNEFFPISLSKSIWSIK